MKKILSSILVLLFSCSGAEEAKDTLSYDYEAVEETQGETPCQEKEQFCDGDQAVECIGGQYQYHKCGEKEFCNFGKCAGIHVAFPKDAASHDVVMEWWYYTGHLTDGAGEWGFQVTIFKVNEDFFGATGYMCHVAVIDKKSKEHYYSYSLTSVADMWTDSPAEFMVNECHLKLDGAGTDAVRAAIPEGEEGNGKKGGWEIDISLETEKKAAYHGTDGIVRMGSEGNDSYYYSYTRMNAQGELTTPDGKRAVTGQGWMDHQWGMFDINAFKGWDWWSMQFEDGYEVMLFQFRDWSDNLVHQAGTISDPQGNLT
ncbi:MAG: hypothetical protein FJ088_16655, partial [Deltaproteobacteria bacterium]|nr:hypothetical protein [Deltaproteobacteria bacterium]